jgi:hypothetical protein
MIRLMQFKLKIPSNTKISSRKPQHRNPFKVTCENYQKEFANTQIRQCFLLKVKLVGILTPEAKQYATIGKIKSKRTIFFFISR